jgi:hypothetical protein
MMPRPNSRATEKPGAVETAPSLSLGLRLGPQSSLWSASSSPWRNVTNSCSIFVGSGSWHASNARRRPSRIYVDRARPSVSH